MAQGWRTKPGWTTDAARAMLTTRLSSMKRWTPTKMPNLRPMWRAGDGADAEDGAALDGSGAELEDDETRLEEEAEVDEDAELEADAEDELGADDAVRAA